jgi:hypothetical protein
VSKIIYGTQCERQGPHSAACPVLITTPTRAPAIAYWATMR